MSGYAQVIVDVAPAHLDRPFDYAVAEGQDCGVGSRVRVVFAGRRRTGWVVGRAATTPTDPAKVRALAAVDGEVRWFDQADVALFRWVADRYAGTMAAVLRHALPARVARVEAEVPRSLVHAPTAPVRPACPAKAWRPYNASAMLRAAAGSGPPGAFAWRPLVGDDRAAMGADLVARCLSAGRTALVLVPDPASPVAAAALDVAGAAGADLRALDQPAARYRAFLRARRGELRLVAGERSATLFPLRDLGLVIVDDEANPGYKERRSPRHHARDVALARARFAGATAVLVTDLSSANAWRHRAAGHLQLVAADRATERSRAPAIQVTDRSLGPASRRRTRIDPIAGRAMARALADGGAVVVLAARRGQGSVLACAECGQRLACPVCAGTLASAEEAEARLCRACGWSGPPEPCARCGALRTAPLAAGAGRLAQELTRAYPDAEVVRMEGFDAPGPSRRPAIAVMTRGSVVAAPAWLHGAPADLLLIDADAMLARPMLAAGEDALRLWAAAARWARRVIVSTREPSHPAVQALLRWDLDGFWEREAPRRAELAYPPSTSLVEIAAPADAAAVAAELRSALPPADTAIGPTPEGSVLVKSPDLRGTLGALTPLRHAWARDDRKVRIDVDPA